MGENLIKSTLYNIYYFICILWSLYSVVVRSCTSTSKFWELSISTTSLIYLNTIFSYMTYLWHKNLISRHIFTRHDKKKQKKWTLDSLRAKKKNKNNNIITTVYIISIFVIYLQIHAAQAAAAEIVSLSQFPYRSRGRAVDESSVVPPLSPSTHLGQSFSDGVGLVHYQSRNDLQILPSYLKYLLI